MAIAYKLTTQDMTTHCGYQWTVGEWRETNGHGDLCGPGWLHAYTDPVLALFLNPIHANIQNPRLWEVEVERKHRNDHGLKVGYTKMRLAHEVPVVLPTAEQRVRFAIACACAVYRDPYFLSWAQAWIAGEERSQEAAWSAAMAAWSAGSAGSAGMEAWSAARAARAAACSVEACSVEAWSVETRAAEAAEAAAEARAAGLDWPMLAYWAMSESMVLPLLRQARG